jgi:hypothetical protein
LTPAAISTRASGGARWNPRETLPNPQIVGYSKVYLPKSLGIPGNLNRVRLQMKVIRSTKENPPARNKLRNFDLSVEEIRILRAIKEMTDAFERISANNPDPARLDFYGHEIKKLKEQLDDIRDNTLLR